MRHSRWMALGGIGIAATLALAGCGGSGFDDGPAASGEPSDAGGLTSSDDALTIMIGSSGDAETTAVKDAVAAWSEESGVDAEVVAATDLTQQLSQSFAGGNPPDLF